MAPDPNVTINLSEAPLDLFIGLEFRSSIFLFQNINFLNKLEIFPYDVEISTGTGSPLGQPLITLDIIAYPMVVRSRATFTPLNKIRADHTYTLLDQNFNTNSNIRHLTTMELNATLGDLKVVKNDPSKLPLLRTRDWEEVVITNIADKITAKYIMKHSLYNYSNRKRSYKSGVISNEQ